MVAAGAEVRGGCPAMGAALKAGEAEARAACRQPGSSPGFPFPQGSLAMLVASPRGMGRLEPACVTHLLSSPSALSLATSPFLPCFA